MAAYPSTMRTIRLARILGGSFEFFWEAEQQLLKSTAIANLPA
jgi:hypothetical protein